jgi:hypothetical protein
VEKIAAERFHIFWPLIWLQDIDSARRTPYENDLKVTTTHAWRNYVLDAYEVETLRLALEALDRAAQARRALKRDGLSVTDRLGTLNRTRPSTSRRSPAGRTPTSWRASTCPPATTRRRPPPSGRSGGSADGPPTTTPDPNWIAALRDPELREVARQRPPHYRQLIELLDWGRAGELERGRFCPPAGPLGRRPDRCNVDDAAEK